MQLPRAGTIARLLLAVAVGSFFYVHAQAPEATLGVYRCDLTCSATGDLVTEPAAMDELASNGSASAVAVTDGETLTILGTYEGLTGPILADLASGVHLHRDPGTYHVDTLIRGFQNDGGTAGTFGGTIVLTPAYRSMLRAGRMYVDIHTTAFPEGELAGMLTVVDVSGLELR